MSQYKYSDYVFPKVLPWETILEDLKKTGYNAYQVSILVGAKWSSFQNVVNVEPRDSMARAILKIHSRYCGEELTIQRISEGK